ncbi:hypothetical protein Q4519_06655 [Motilimonas sp. 1_MG-2023]|uniref:hypothetical protein n=1 Tax=Motilimonas sp. 1_MG-2023 TaxID=3062672 RepID=UPI0026E3B8F5|nr:hypothetical protein [Motilimonas sp. 1_MG-2023]MDO6525363.1 hypothetical protein [Motilimonas sp. 1_MG-2023]
MFDRFIVFFALFIGVFPLHASNKVFPPVPDWRPNFTAEAAMILEQLVFYTNDQKDMVQFSNGTLVLLPDRLSDTAAYDYALKVLSDIYNYHPDMKPIAMKDGNIVVQYNHPAVNVVLTGFTAKHMDEIRQLHLNGLVTDEVLITPLGNNIFDDFGMQALYGRALMFMDAQDPVIIRLYRHAKANQ